MNVEEIKYVLEMGSQIDSVVEQWGAAMLVQNTSAMYQVTGVKYSQANNVVGFVVTMHGMTLVPSYAQVKIGEGSFPELLARVSICLSDAEGQPGDVLCSVLINKEGHYSVDGRKHFAYGIAGNAVDQGRHRLSMTIAEAVQKRLDAV